MKAEFQLEQTSFAGTQSIVVLEKRQKDVF